MPGQGSELPTESCPLCTGSWREGRAEKWNSGTSWRLCTHLHTRLHVHSYHTHVPQAHGHAHTHMYTHTQVLQRPDFQFRILTLGCSSPAEKEDKGTSPSPIPTPLPGKRGPGCLETQKPFTGPSDVSPCFLPDLHEASSATTKGPCLSPQLILALLWTGCVSWLSAAPQ